MNKVNLVIQAVSAIFGMYCLDNSNPLISKIKVANVPNFNISMMYEYVHS